MKRQSLVFLLGSLCVVSTALATTYMRVEKDGSKTYSDRPIPGGQPVDLQPAQTYSTPAAQPSPDSQRPREEQLLEESFQYQSCTVTPEADTTFQNPESVDVSVAINPQLRPDDVLTLTVDGQSAGANSQGYTLSPVPRGTHAVEVRITSPTGAVVCSSTSSFHVMQSGLNSPARQASPPPRPRPPPPRPTPH